MDAAPVVTLPRAGPAREKLREKGQFWTPDWVSDAMVAWAVKDSDHLFEPGVGAGAFFRAAKRYAARTARSIRLSGCELDPAALQAALSEGLGAADLKCITVGDFMEVDASQRSRAIVANPPYVRHHRFSAPYKAMLKSFGLQLTGRELDGRAGLHVFFLMKALTLLEEGGRLAFIVPADTCEGRFAPVLWNWIGREYRVDGAITFEAEASPFPGVDTNPIILLISKRPPAPTMRWVRVRKAGGNDLRELLDSEFGATSCDSLTVINRAVPEALATGLTRQPVDEAPGDSIELGALFKVVRGIATGDNDYFFMSSARIHELGLPLDVFLRAIGRTRDHNDGPTLTLDHLNALDRQGRPTYLLSLGRVPFETLSRSMQAYLRIGEEKGLPARPLISQRKPWYKMETRSPPSWLFAYLGRRACRFLRNEAAAMPLTGFLCVYPLKNDALDYDAATRVLNDPRTLSNLGRVAKSYGGGALKVEPRGLERLPIPRTVLLEHGLRAAGQDHLL